MENMNATGQKRPKHERASSIDPSLDVKTHSSTQQPITISTGFASLVRGRVPALAFAVILVAVLSITVYRALGESSLSSLDTQPAASEASTSETQAASPAEEREPSIISQMFGAKPLNGEEDTSASGWMMRVSRMGLRLLVAALLAAMLAFRPRRRIRLPRRNPYVAQTQILLAVVASALMMIVSDNAARAFGIFAAASLVRFRTNIQDPKEITVLLINLAIGLGAGVGRFELAIMLAAFVLAMLWILENYESRQLVRSMQLKIRTHDVTATDDIVRAVFERHSISAELREIDREDQDNPLGRIVYHAAVSSAVNTDQLTEEIFTGDPHNVDTVEWHQKKGTTHLYR